jgi:integrase
VPSNIQPQGERFGARTRAAGWLGTYDTRELAQAAVDRSRGKRPAVETVAEWSAVVWELFPGRRSEETTEHYVAMCAPFVRARGRMRLADVDVLVAQAWAVAHPGHVPYLRRMFGKAVRARLLVENVWEDVEVETRGSTRLPPSPAVLAAILAECARRGGWWAETFAVLVQTAAYTGARLTGLAGLQVADVDLVARRMVVTEKGEKTRTIALLGPAAGVLAPLLHERVGRVFSTRTGRCFTVETVGTAWRDVAQAVGWEHPFHGLKHYAATWLRSLGAEKDDVAIQLGHFDALGRPYTDLVERVYSHPDHGIALDRLERVVSAWTGSTEPLKEGSAA